MTTPVLAVFGNTLIYSASGSATVRALPDGADMSAAIMQMLDEANPAPSIFDVVYQPHELHCVVAECANTTRAKLGKIFAGEYRELTNPAISWAVTKPQPHLDGKYTTVLHYEARPRLEHVFHLLAENHSARVRVAVPPAALLTVRTKSDGLDLALLVAGDDYLFYHVNELGKPAIRLLRSFDTLTEHLGAALASRKNPPAHVLVVCETEEIPPRVTDFLGSHALTPRVETWPVFLATEAFSPSDCANLAQRPFKWRRAHTLLAIAAVATLAAGVLAYDYGVDSYRALQNEKNIEQRRRTLTAEVAKLTAAKDAYLGAKEVVDAVPLPNPRPSAFLDAVTQAMPPALQLQGFRYRDAQFTIDGIAYEGVGQEKGPFAQFIDSLAAGGARPWEFKAPKATLNSAAWTLTGTLKP